MDRGWVEYAGWLKRLTQQKSENAERVTVPPIRNLRYLETVRCIQLNNLPQFFL